MDARVDRALELVDAARSTGLTVALLGGAAIAATCSSARGGGPFARAVGDVDLAAAARDRRRIDAFAQVNGLRDDGDFNRVNGEVRLRYLDSDESHVDVFLDEMRLCHVIRWGRLRDAERVLALPELFLTKTQIVRLEQKDLGDLSALLLDRGEELWTERERLARLVRNDWGLWRTTRGSLERLADAAHPEVATRGAALLEFWKSVPLSPQGRVRALIGDRMRWYEEPEEV